MDKTVGWLQRPLFLGEYNLADMFRLGHVPEGADRFLDGKDTVRQRLERPCLDACHQLAQHLLDQVWLLVHDIAQVKGKISGIWLQSGYLAFIPNARPANLQETAV